MPDAPTLTTDRLTLRAQRVEDFEPFAAMMATDRAVHMGGPFTRKQAWLWFAADSGSWSLTNSGGWTVERRADGAILGQVGCNKPDFFPEFELGWMLYDEHEGQGYAAEAASAARDWAFGPRGLRTLVSYVSPENAPSVRLAERLGATRDEAAARPDPEDLVFRHPHPGGSA
ncbi:GNAT family N-acetyltransferase [Tropicimonas isoalkanivorans]|uniref:Protein N-acetyltransferase, RimJ/RimL family n=1 Tax=Tropicimonas isoalkanivorans TaxID=441112 RepID=A0A1I1JQG4_9RHOB|nr:GNAT family N-acetyltransferase [Tropicimonas isoalkanivorans]SFC50869.1 Protein N-acetyltransferase, RimJ/RimL family [Tropicimonas isoalkanivorans]